MLVSTEFHIKPLALAMAYSTLVGNPPLRGFLL
jgi:hypothetical protein